MRSYYEKVGRIGLLLTACLMTAVVLSILEATIFDSIPWFLWLPASLMFGMVVGYSVAEYADKLDKS